MDVSLDCGEMIIGTFGFDFKHEGIRYLDSNGNQLCFSDSFGWWIKSTHDSFGNELEFIDSDGYWEKRTYNSAGKELSCISSTYMGYCVSTY